MDKTKETRITIRFPADLAEELRILAEQEERSINGEVVHALREYVASKKRKKVKV